MPLGDGAGERQLGLGVVCEEGGSGGGSRQSKVIQLPVDTGLSWGTPYRELGKGLGTVAEAIAAVPVSRTI